VEGLFSALFCFLFFRAISRLSSLPFLFFAGGGVTPKNGWVWGTPIWSFFWDWSPDGLKLFWDVFGFPFRIDLGNSLYDSQEKKREKPDTIAPFLVLGTLIAIFLLLLPSCIGIFL